MINKLKLLNNKITNNWKYQIEKKIFTKKEQINQYKLLLEEIKITFLLVEKEKYLVVGEMRL